MDQMNIQPGVLFSESGYKRRHMIVYAFSCRPVESVSDAVEQAVESGYRED